jgi:hypothetical protein
MSSLKLCSTSATEGHRAPIAIHAGWSGISDAHVLANESPHHREQASQILVDKDVIAGDKQFDYEPVRLASSSFDPRLRALSMRTQECLFANGTPSCQVGEILSVVEAP